MVPSLIRAPFEIPLILGAMIWANYHIIRTYGVLIMARILETPGIQPSSPLIWTLNDPYMPMQLVLTMAHIVVTRIQL